MLLPGRPTERLLCEQGVCGERAPEVWISFKGLQGLL